jgi:hypothetical protein
MSSVQIYEIRQEPHLIYVNPATLRAPALRGSQGDGN